MVKLRIVFLMGCEILTPPLLPRAVLVHLSTGGVISLFYPCLHMYVEASYPVKTRHQTNKLPGMKFGYGKHIWDVSQAQFEHYKTVRISLLPGFGGHILTAFKCRQEAEELMCL